jgi:hypothetical protein
VVLYLRQQNIFKQGPAVHVVLARPMALQYFIVAIGEECIRVSFEDRFQEMHSTKAVVQKNLTALLEGMGLPRKLV